MLSNDLKQALNNLDLLNVKNDKEAEFYDKINYLFSHDNIIKEKYKLLVDEIKKLILNARKRVAEEVNVTLIHTYWNVGKVIVESSRRWTSARLL